MIEGLKIKANKVLFGENSYSCLPLYQPPINTKRISSLIGPINLFVFNRLFEPVPFNIFGNLLISYAVIYWPTKQNLFHFCGGLYWEYIQTAGLILNEWVIILKLIPIVFFGFIH